MVDITQYLEEIFGDFCCYANGENYLCELKKLNFQAGSIPDYSNKKIQQLYLLRYAFAYAFEYKSMYEDMFPKIKNLDNLKVTSIGCGAMIDYWSLVKLLLEKKMEDKQIAYIGVDEINWNYKIRKRSSDFGYLKNKNIVDYLNEIELFDSDIYFFPKSISEFDDNEMKLICKNFKEKEIIKNTILLGVSLRCDSGSRDRDMEKVKLLIEAISKNGFITKDSCEEYIYYEGNAGIAAYDRQFVYPPEAINYLKELNIRCKEFIENGTNCENDCLESLNRWPILKTNTICYQIIELERV
jgi:hypothetical protein